MRSRIIIESLFSCGAGCAERHVTHPDEEDVVGVGVLVAVCGLCALSVLRTFASNRYIHSYHTIQR